MPANGKPTTLFAALALSLPAMAQQDGKTEPEPTLEPVVVTATRSERSLSDVPASVSVISKEDIALTPAQSVDEVMRSVGMEMSLISSYQSHPTSNMVSMRGLKSGVTSHALVMVDGVPINDSFSGFVQWNRVPLENIDRIEVVRGGGATLWGTYALGGVVNILTRAPAKQALEVEGGYGTYGTYRVNAYGAVAPTETTAFSIEASRWGTNGFNQVAPQWRNDSTIWGKTSFDADNVQLAGALKPDPTLSARFRVNYHHNDQTLLTPVDTNNQRIWNADLSVTKTFGKDDLTATLFHNDSNFLTNNSGWDAYFNATPGFPTQEVLSNTHVSKAKDTGGSVAWTSHINEIVPMASIGIDARQISGSDTGTIYDDVYGSTTGTPGAFLRTDYGSGRQFFGGLFGQIDIFPVSSLEILGSVRAQYWRNYDGFDATGPTGGLGNLPDRSKTSVDPRIALRYEATRNLALRAAAYTAFNAPNLDLLHRSYGISGGIFLPNANLEPERLRGAEVGTDIRIGNTVTQITLFGNELRDAFTSVPLTAEQLALYNVAFGTQWANAGKVRSRGLEWSTKWTITPALTGQLNYTYTNAKIIESPDPAQVGQALAYLPKHQASVGLLYDDKRYQASVIARYVGTSIGVQGDPTFYESNGWGVHQDAHMTFDASLGMTVNRTLSCFVQAVNLFNRQYIADNSGYFAPLRGSPRTLFAGVRLKLN